VSLPVPKLRLGLEPSGNRGSSVGEPFRPYSNHNPKRLARFAMAIGRLASKRWGAYLSAEIDADVSDAELRPYPVIAVSRGPICVQGLFPRA
jgi:hypothetical protein